MPFKPGKSGNPGGRSKIVAEELAKFRHGNDLKAFRDALRSIATNEDNDARDRIAAIKEWHDRAYGKPSQEVTASVEVNDASADDLHSRIAALVAVAVSETDTGSTGEPH